MDKLKMFVVATIMMFAFVAMPAMAAETEKPKATYQTYEMLTGILTVLIGNINSAVHFVGLAEDYDGTAVSPQAPTSQWFEKQAAISAIADLERNGKTDEAQKLKVKWHIK